MEALSDPPCFLIKASNAFSSGYFSLPMKTTVKKAIMIIVNKQNCRTYYLLKLSRYLRTNWFDPRTKEEQTNRRQEVEGIISNNSNNNNNNNNNNDDDDLIC